MYEVAFEFYNPGTLVDGDLQLVLTRTNPGFPDSDPVPVYLFRMMRTGQQEQMGSISLRIGRTKHIVMYAGHIGYGVEPGYRGHHYAARACRLLFPLARRHHIDPLWITCNPDNIASRRTCEYAGATLVDIVDLPEDTDMYRRGERQKCRYRIIL